MADIPEKDTAAAASPYEANSVEETAGRASRGKAWMYRRFNFAGISIPHYASPPAQLLIVSLVCFLCPGMFNAINGLGAGGQVSAHDSNNANVAVYSTFSVVGFFAGSIANRIGLRLTLSLGGLGYFIYTSSILCYNHTQNAGFFIFAGALLGACAGLLWTAQGAVMMAYPPEAAKGRYISWFWMIFNLGAVIGGLVSTPSSTSSQTTS
jgi:MFS family permease